MMKTLENKILFAVGLLVAFYLNHAAATESNQITPPKKPTIIEQKIDSAKMWAIGFGADVKKSTIQNLKQSKEALHNDWSWSEGGRFTYPIKNAWEDFVAYQKQGNRQAKDQLQRHGSQIRSYWQNIADALGVKAGSVEK